MASSVKEEGEGSRDRLPGKVRRVPAESGRSYAERPIGGFQEFTPTTAAPLLQNLPPRHELRSGLDPAHDRVVSRISRTVHQG